MKTVSKKVAVRIGVDISKNYFQLHGVDEHGNPVIRKRVTRNNFLNTMTNIHPCIVGMEACGSAHYWGRELEKMGFTIRIIPARFVKAYVTSNKNDAIDADAICEAAAKTVRIHFVHIKTIEQQDMQLLHRIRQSILRDRTAKSNHIRGLLYEYGIIVSKGANKIRKELPSIIEDADQNLSTLARQEFVKLNDDLVKIDERFNEITEQIEKICKENETCNRLCEMDGIGPLAATAIVSAIGNGIQFKNGRCHAAWLGIIPRQYSTGGKQVLLKMTKHGNVYIRTLLIHGARSVVSNSKKKTDPLSIWIQKTVAKKGINAAAVVLANKLARIAWSIVRSGQPYKKAA